MNESLRVQESIKKNADELQQYFADMKTWENEIKEKEKQLKQAKCREPNMPFPRNIRCRKDPAEIHEVDNIQPTKKVKSQLQASTDEPHKTDSYQNIDEAYFEKELGNKLVKEQKWADAINCYTKAIALDSNNAVYFANRAMCYIKLGKWKLAEVDSTVAIQLDKTYVKAYKRRAFIRKTMNHYVGAREDYERVLDLEPDCVEARQEIADLTKRIEEKEANKAKPATFNYKNMFASSDTKKKVGSNSTPSQKPAAFNYKNIFSASDSKKPENPEPPEKVSIIASEETAAGSQDEGISIMPIVKPTHLRSKKPLQRVLVKQVEGRGAAWEYFEQNSPPVDDSTSGCQIVTPERKEAGPPIVRTFKPQNNVTPIVNESQVLEALPKTYVQFVAMWRQTVDSHELRYKLLKAVCPTLAKIVGSSLEIDVLSEIIAEMADEYFLRDAALLLDLLQSLSNVERLQSLVLFLSTEDEKRLENIFLQLARHYPEDVQKLRSTYFS